MPEIKELPILFSAPMVRAILEGRKTVTRRVVKPQYSDAVWQVKPAKAPRHDRHSHDWWLPTGTQPYAALPRCSYGQPGDRLWVRETWAADAQLDAIAPRELSQGEPILFPADGALREVGCSMISPGRSRPSIHMPRWASRILLEITAVGVERLHAINPEQCLAEGVQPFGTEGYHIEDGRFYTDHPYETFAGIWQSINGEQSWRDNPWVWVVEFKQVTP